jgi:hypothetical protein
VKVRYTLEEGILRFFFEEEAEYIPPSKVKMGQRECEFHLPPDFKIEDVHPDALALAMALIILPFSSSITLPFEVSRPFAETFTKHTKVNIGPIDDQLQPRKSRELSIPGATYSGGVDSTAAVAILPRTTALFFVDRIPKGDSKYNIEAAHNACEQMKKLGRSMYMVKTDLEYVRNPVGFPVEYACAVPAILLSDYVGIDSIAFGTIMEAAYRTGHPKFQDFQQREYYQKWSSIFKAIDLPFNYVVVGMSEVATAKLVLQTPFRDFAQSCIRGRVGAPCMNCWKCFRKILLQKTLKGEHLSDSELNQYFRIKDAQIMMQKTPIKLENVLTYITSKYNGDHSLMNDLKRKVRGDTVNASWMEKWFTPSEELIHPKYRDYVKNKIASYLEFMTEEEINQARQWEIPSTEEYLNKSKLFAESLQALA